MKNNKARQTRLLSGILSLLLLSTVLFPSTAFAAAGETVTVAYIDYNDFIEKSASDAYVGYGADYLNKIAEYTGWNYEYVDMDWQTAYDAVKAGTVDFYCVARQTEERQSDFDFSLYPVCNEEMNLYTMPGSSLYYEDFQALNGLKIGMLAQSNEIAYFEKYAKDHDFAYTLVEYPMNEDAIQALIDGKVDAIALVNYSVGENLKLIGNFGVSPAYLMSADNSPYMEEFSKAQERLFFDLPNYQQELENKYYGNSKQYTDLHLTREEAEYIGKIKNSPLNVAISVDMAPTEYFDISSGTYQGLTIDLYLRIHALTGLNFNFVPRGDKETLLRQIKDGEVQLVGSLAKSSNVATSLQVTQTTAFTENSFTLVTKDMTALSEGSVIAIPSGYPQFIANAREQGYSEFIECGTFKECISAVYSGKADATYIISMCESYLLNHVRYTSLKTAVCADSGYGVCLGVSEECDPRLVSVLNKCIAAISDREVNDMIVSNTAAARPPMTVEDYIVANRFYLLAAGGVLLALVAVLFIRGQKTRQQKEINRKLSEHHAFLQHLYDTLPCGVFQYEFNAPHTILNFNESCAKMYGYEKDTFPVIGQSPDCVVEAGTEKDFQEKFVLCEKTQKPISYIWPVTRKDGSTAYTESVMDIVETDKGKVFQEVVLDVTDRVYREKEIQKRYEQELDRIGSRKEGLLFTACIDIADQVITQTDIDTDGVRAGMTVTEFMDRVSHGIRELQTAEWFKNFRNQFSTQKMEEAYENGRLEGSSLLCRRKNGKLQWLRCDRALRHHPATGHLMCFGYIWDVTDEQISKTVIRNLALTDCESFMSVDMATGNCLQYEVMANRELKRSEASYGSDDLIQSLSEQMGQEDRDAFRLAVSLDSIKQHLPENEHMQTIAILKDENGERRDKAITFFYTDRKNGILAVAVSDVTEVRASEVRHAELLADALAAAEKADAAKSQFLSRVSHEMRTPLNAIIGFIELAKDADAEKAANCLASSDLAAKQLLNVINDVLDMSSIESGKMKMAATSFNFRHLISSLTNIYGTQCKQKGVNFEVKITTPVEDWLVGDELRVNQILMNLLGNAVKFTSEGHIWLTVTVISSNQDKVFIRFTVTDTGCGMSEQMKERLFKPFEQESATTARKYGGSGLGLSIVKSLSNMMGGSVSVQSVQGEGSVFTVDLPFRKSDIGQDLQLSEKISTLRVLTVDDEKAEREYMSLALNRLGVRFTCVESGDEAIAAMEQSEQDHDIYNVCLIDWRMPHMNGMETTKRIRAKYGKNVVVIVVSAYDFHQAGESAREAGANLFLSKPVFQSSLFDLFMTLTGGKIAKPKTEMQSFHFTGKRVLLVEDNVLNQIVAKGYLAKCNVVVELAENGQMAVNMFNASPVGYYNAILMDIQMPVMDGYESTKAIRACGHPDAKTIPIIAQSADAFNEDVTKALSVGMNAHIAKPIKPDILAKALYTAFTSKPDCE